MMSRNAEKSGSLIPEVLITPGSKIRIIALVSRARERIIEQSQTSVATVRYCHHHKRHFRHRSAWPNSEATVSSTLTRTMSLSQAVSTYLITNTRQADSG